MNSQRAIVPMIDLVFLALGGVLGALTEMQVVKAIPVDIAQVGTGSAVVRHDEFSVLALDQNGMTLDGQPISRDQISQRVVNKNIILRVDRTLPTETTVQILAEISKSGARVSIEVCEQELEIVTFKGVN